ncbi:unnamed protein product, partial [Iphiclides podalirius]
MLCSALLVAALTCLHIYMRLLNRRDRRMLAHLPTYSCLPFIGNMHRFIGDGERALRHLDKISQITEKTGKPFVVWVGQRCFLVLADLEETKIVANAFIEKPYYYKFAHMWLRDGLLTAPGCVWRSNVKKISGTFKGVMVDGFLPIFNERAEKLAKLLEGESNKEPFDMTHKYLAFIALEAIFQTALSKSEKVENTVTENYYNASQRLLELIFDRSLNIFLHPEWIYSLTPAYREMKRCVRVIHEASEAILKIRRNELEVEKTTIAQKTTDAGDEPFRSFLDTLLDMSSTDDALTDSQIQAEVNTIILAGQETVTTAVNFVFLMLGCRPDVQRTLYEEVKEVFGERKRAVLKEDLPRLKYCEAVILETMRLLPPVPGVLRSADHDLDLGSYTVPRGATCCLNLWGLGRSRRLWSDALCYRPERWLHPNNEPALPILNFSIGRRACIGKRYALSLMKIIIVHCVREFEFTSEAENLALRVDISLRPASGHLICVRSRKTK